MDKPGHNSAGNGYVAWLVLTSSSISKRECHCRNSYHVFKICTKYQDFINFISVTTVFVSISYSIHSWKCCNFKNINISFVWVTDLPSKLRKNHKIQEHGSHGDGHISKNQKHWGSGGHASGRHHHTINLGKHYLGYFDKVRMRHNHLKRNRTSAPLSTSLNYGPWSVSRHG